jgi:hypothetical protein
VFVAGEKDGVTLPFLGLQQFPEEKVGGGVAAVAAAVNQAQGKQGAVDGVAFEGAIFGAGDGKGDEIVFFNRLPQSFPLGQPVSQFVFG